MCAPAGTVAWIWEQYNWLGVKIKPIPGFTADFVLLTLTTVDSFFIGIGCVHDGKPDDCWHSREKLAKYCDLARLQWVHYEQHTHLKMEASCLFVTLKLV